MEQKGFIMEERTTEEDDRKELKFDPEMMENMNAISTEAYNTIVSEIGDLKLTNKEKDLLLLNSIMNILLFVVRAKVKKNCYEEILEKLRKGLVEGFVE